MQINHYDAATGRYLSTGLADRDALVNDGWIIPAYATPSGVPEHDPDSERARYCAADGSVPADYRAGTWIVEPIHIPPPPPEPSVNDVFDQLIASVNGWRDAQERQLITFEHAGRAWDGGLVVRTRLQPVVALPALPEGFFWTDADNVDVPMDKPALEALNAAHEAAIVTRGFEIHVRQRQMKQEVAALETVEELQAYEIGWP